MNVTYEYLHCSMAGSYWLDAQYVSHNPTQNEVTIKYFDSFMDGIIEANVEVQRVRAVIAGGPATIPFKDLHS